MAHFSTDSALVAALCRQVDLFTAMASALFRCQPQLVTPAQRKIAKTIAYAILYCAGAENVRAELAVPLAEAKANIGAFHSAFPGVRAHATRVVAKARVEGYVSGYVEGHVAVPRAPTHACIRTPTYTPTPTPTSTPGCTHPHTPLASTPRCNTDTLRRSAGGGAGCPLSHRPTKPRRAAPSASASTRSARAPPQTSSSRRWSPSTPPSRPAAARRLERRAERRPCARGCCCRCCVCLFVCMYVRVHACM